MKTKIATAILTLANAIGFTQDAVVQPVTESIPTKIDVTLHKAEKKLPRHSFFYVRTEAAPIASIGVVPGFGVGYRLSSDFSAVDFSANAVSGYDSEDSLGAAWTFPKINYLYYLSPKGDNSLYVGGGVALGGITSKINDEETDEVAKNYFQGLLTNAVVGYEMMRNDRFRTFIQLDVNQPTIAAVRKGDFPAPWASFSVGAGF